MAQFLKEISALIRNSNAQQIANRLSLSTSDSSKKLFLDSLATKSYQAALSECERAMSDDWAEVVCHCVFAAQRKRAGQWSEACTHQESAVEAFLRVFKSLNRIFVPVLKALILDLRRLAAQADRALRQSGNAEDANKLEGAGRVLRKCLAQEMKDEENPPPVSRTWAALYVANQCNQVFFSLNTLKHVKSLVLPGQMAVEEFPLPDRITWSFFQGRMALLDGQLDKAETDLSFAFNNTPPTHISNRRRVLIYLIPVRLMLHQARPGPGRRAGVPTEEMLARYRLPQFAALARAFREGHIGDFDQALEDHQARSAPAAPASPRLLPAHRPAAAHAAVGCASGVAGVSAQEFLVRKGVYMLLHRLKLLVYRNLFKRAHAVVRHTHPTQVKLEVFVCAVRACRVTADQEQVECMLANLIHQGLVKGYIAHKQQVVVLKKDDPFRTNP